MATAPSPVLPSVPESPRTALSLKPILLAVALAVAVGPLLFLQGRLLWAREHYQFFPFVVAGAIWLVWNRFQTLGQLTPGNPLVAGALLVLGWCLLAGATVLHSPWLGTVATLILLAILAYGAGGVSLCWQLLPIWLFLFLLVPPPFNLDQKLVSNLQFRTAHWSSRILDQLGILHVMHGNVVVLPQRSLFVEEACSGINSLLSTLACTWFYILWMHRGPIRAILLLVAALGWVILSNTMRVVGIAWALSSLNLDLVKGWKHEVFGTFLFVITLALIWSTDRFLLFLDPIGWFRGALASSTPNRAPVRNVAPERVRWPQADRLVFLGWPAALAFVVLAVVQVGVLVAARTPNIAENERGPLVEAVHKLDVNSLPPNMKGWVRDGFDTVHRDRNDSNGEHSRYWRYRKGRLAAIVSVDYPFGRWHELTVCYESNGWKREHRLQREARLDGQTASPFMEVDLRKSAHEQALLLFANVTRSGEALQPLVEAPMTALLENRLNTRASLGLDDHQPCYQVQVLQESSIPLTANEKREVEELFLQAWELLRTKVAQPAS